MRKPSTFHPSVTEDRVAELYEVSMSSLSDPSICVACGIEGMSGVEPDAQDYPCESCGENAVYGVEQLLLMMVA